MSNKRGGSAVPIAAGGAPITIMAGVALIGVVDIEATVGGAAGDHALIAMRARRGVPWRAGKLRPAHALRRCLLLALAEDPSMRIKARRVISGRQLR